MPISSVLKKIHAAWTDTPLSGFLRAADLTQKLDVAVSESVTLQTFPEDTLFISEFGEQRVSSPGNRFDVEFLYDKQPLIVDDISSGTGSATHRANSRDILLAVGGAGNGATGGMRQHYWTPYTPGNGQEIDLTGVPDLAGLGGIMQVFLRSSVSGTTTLQTIDQGSWSAVNELGDADWSKSHIFRISFQSLRVGRIQFSLARHGPPVKVYEINNDNVRNTGYWQYASLPMYWKIFNTADNTIVEFGYGDEFNGVGFRYVMDLDADATAIAICGTVKSQSGVNLFQIPGFHFSASNYLTPLSVSTTLIPVLSIRNAATFNSIANRTLTIPEEFSLESDNPIYYRIVYRPTLTNPVWNAVNATYSTMEVDVAATALTGGITIHEDYLNSGVVNREERIAGVMGRTIMALGATNAPDILTLAAIRTGASNASVLSTLKWREVR